MPIIFSHSVFRFGCHPNSCARLLARYSTRWCSSEAVNPFPEVPQTKGCLEPASGARPCFSFRTKSQIGIEFGIESIGMLGAQLGALNTMIKMQVKENRLHVSLSPRMPDRILNVESNLNVEDLRARIAPYFHQFEGDSACWTYADVDLHIPTICWCETVVIAKHPITIHISNLRLQG